MSRRVVLGFDPILEVVSAVLEGVAVVRASPSSHDVHLVLKLDDGGAVVGFEMLDPRGLTFEQWQRHPDRGRLPADLLAEADPWFREMSSRGSKMYWKITSRHVVWLTKTKSVNCVRVSSGYGVRQPAVVLYLSESEYKRLFVPITSPAFDARMEAMHSKSDAELRRLRAGGSASSPSSISSQRSKQPKRSKKGAVRRK